MLDPSSLSILYGMNTTHTNHPSTVRVRFAPSPTGYLHVGGLRTALYNYLFAKHHGGAFILRIEDTDQSRFVEGAIENLLRTLEWVGLKFDEGPSVEGNFGPYIQSQRLDIYRSEVTRLLEKKHAYYCFCTPEELETSRHKQLSENQGAMYDRRCRRLSPEEVSTKLDAGMAHTIRMKAPLDGEVSFHDLIRGDVTVPCSVIDDQVLLKSDGFPTYHLANVVDDHLMAITHVIRGEEWLPSTAKHVLLYQAFGWDIPQFAHLPLLLNPDKSKLSKRQGDVAVEDFREKGFLPEALLNFVALLGWSTTDNRELFTLTELIHEFSLERVGKSGAIFDLEKLRWFNARYLHELDSERLVSLCIPFLLAEGCDVSDNERTRAIIEAVRTRMTLPLDVVAETVLFYSEGIQWESDEVRAMTKTDTARVVLLSAHAAFTSLTEWKRDPIKAAIKDVQQTTGIKGKDLFMPIRIALTGASHGLDLPVIAELLGKDVCLSRIQMATLSD